MHGFLPGSWPGRAPTACSGDQLSLHLVWLIRFPVLHSPVSPSCLPECSLLKPSSSTPSLGPCPSGGNGWDMRTVPGSSGRISGFCKSGTILGNSGLSRDLGSVVLKLCGSPQAQPVLRGRRTSPRSCPVQGRAFWVQTGKREAFVHLGELRCGATSFAALSSVDKFHLFFDFGKCIILTLVCSCRL